MSDEYQSDSERAESYRIILCEANERIAELVADNMQHEALEIDATATILGLKKRVAEIKNLCSEAELHRYECECLTCQIFIIAGGKK